MAKYGKKAGKTVESAMHHRTAEQREAARRVEAELP
jgi:hypothetical protein